MLKHLKLAGCEFPSSAMQCHPCDETRAGGFNPDYGILLCQNRFMNKKHMEDTLAHELIHAFDHCRFKVDWQNLRHHACTEIRAANLSGDCRWSREITRGHYAISGQHQTCVKRRAVLSVRAHPNCKSEEQAERAVNEVWDSCFKDTRPFDEVSQVTIDLTIDLLDIDTIICIACILTTPTTDVFFEAATSRWPLIRAGTSHLLKCPCMARL